MYCTFKSLKILNLLILLHYTIVSTFNWTFKVVAWCIKNMMACKRSDKYRIVIYVIYHSTIKHLDTYIHSIRKNLTRVFLLKTFYSVCPLKYQYYSELLNICSATNTYFYVAQLMLLIAMFWRHPISRSNFESDDDNRM